MVVHVCSLGHLQHCALRWDCCIKVAGDYSGQCKVWVVGLTGVLKGWGSHPGNGGSANITQVAPSSGIKCYIKIVCMRVHGMVWYGMVNVCEGLRCYMPYAGDI